ncbi:ABC transporter ATP-binding protein [Alteribacillus sp. JSM 102045]|uniref:ABC transporter ATP-binding protein n=1 Tax=Alteribacillus sp. JSM 102045 TaxID=1562101 RepID=UPI0035C0104B
MMQPIWLQCENLTISFHNHTIFHEVNLSVVQGEILCVVGPSGGGKTTLLRAIAGLLPLAGGRMLLEGEDITSKKAEKRPIVMMFQQSLLFPHMTVLENVAYGLKLQKIGKKERERESVDIIKKVEMGPYFNAYPHELSGGQKQRVAFARALVTKPKLILFDEPFSSLDAVLRISLRTWMKRMLKKEGMTALFVTHDKEEAMILGDRIAVMTNGMIHQVDKPLQVYQSPKNKEVAEFFSEGIMVGDYFISNDKLKIQTCPLAKESEVTYKGTVSGKWMRSGQYFYQIELEQHSRYLTLPGDNEWNVDDVVHITTDQRSLVKLNDVY